MRFEFAFEELRALTRTFDRFQVRPTFDVRPGEVIARLQQQAFLKLSYAFRS